MESEADYDYRSEIGWILMTDDGGIPEPGTLSVTLADHDRLIDQIKECWELTDLIINGEAKRLNYSTSADISEVRLAWHKWMISHVAFFFEFSTLASLYKKLSDCVATGKMENAQIYAERGARLWAGSGALMRHSVDFSPTEDIYKNHIRSMMPEGFSGEWIREWALLNRDQQRWRDLFRGLAEAEATWKAVEERLRSGERVYHSHHKKTMVACVPELQSLARKYERKYGPLNITEQQFAIYDSWFHLHRSKDVSIAQYVESGCWAFCSVLHQVLAGTRLDCDTLTDLVMGVRAALVTMASWLAPLPQSSKHYPRYLRGE